MRVGWMLTKLSTKLLQWPKRFKLPEPDSFVSNCSGHLDSLLGHKGNQKALKTSIISYFEDARNERFADLLNRDCTDLCERLGQSDAGHAGNLPPSARNLSQYDHSIDFDDDLFLALERHSQCNTELHRTEAQTGGDLRHLLRLSLSEPERKAAAFDILVASLGMLTWQEIRLEMWVGPEIPHRSKAQES